MEAGGEAGGAATTAPTWLFCFSFFQNAITCVKNVDKWIVDKCNYMDCG
jgi:hypothetical protein